MDLYLRDVDEYTKNSRQGNKFAPVCPFRLAVSGSSDSGKTTMIMNLLMGDKKIKEDGERYIPCNDVVLIGKFLNEPKWCIVRDFYNKLAEEGEDVSFRTYSPSNTPDVEEFDPSRSTVVVFEDIMNMPKKIQERIADYFSSGRHSNISPIYVSQRFFLIPKTIRENVTYISLHRGAGNLSDIKRIISQYTDQAESLAPVIDDLTLKKEFIIFDLRRSRTDPLSIRVRWDTSLRSIIDDHRSSKMVQESSQSGVESVNILSEQSKSESQKFSIYGQNVVAKEAEKGTLVEFARNMPNSKERKKLLADGIKAKNSDIWARYVFREAYGIDSKDLGPEWIKFSEQLKNNSKPSITKETQLSRYIELLASQPLDDKKLIEGHEILLWLFSNGYIDQKTYKAGINEL
jgi:hypothetical protein